MKLKELLEYSQSLNIELWVDEGKLKFKAPTGVVTKELKAQLKEYKNELIDYFTKKDMIQHDEPNRFQPFEMTDIQTAYLLGSTKTYGFGEIDCKVFLQLETPKLDISRLQIAWEKVIARHDMLRVKLLKNGQQQIQQHINIQPIEVIQCETDDSKQTEEKIKDLQKRCLSSLSSPDAGELYQMVVVTSKQKDYLCLTVDMLIADFFSMKVIVEDLEKLYDGQYLEPLTISFRDYVCWKRRKKDEKLYLEAKNYWLERIGCLPDAPELPNSHEERLDKIEFEQYSYLISQKNWEKLENLAKKYKVTSSTLLLTAYVQVIGLWSRQQDFTLNVTMADRVGENEEILELVGDFTTVNLLEIHNNDRKPFYQLAKELQQQLWNDLRYSHFSGVEVIRELNRQEEATRLFPIVFTSTLGLPKEETSRCFDLVYKISQTPQVLIDCQVSSQAGGVLLNWDVREDSFPQNLIAQAFEKFVERIEACFNSDLAESNYQPLQLPKQTKEIRDKINATKSELPKGFLQDGFFDYAKTEPDRIAVIDKGVSYSYGKLKKQAEQVAQLLFESGVSEGDVVAIHLVKGIEQIAAVLGVLHLGGIYLPLDTEQPDDRKKAILLESEAVCCLTSFEVSFQNIRQVLMEDCQKISHVSFPMARQASTTSPAYIIYTSGSTGTPKGVIISHQATLNTIKDCIQRFHLTSTDRILALANLAFDLSVFDIFAMLTIGGSIVIPEELNYKDPQHWAELIEKYQVTLWNSVPAQLQMFLIYLSSLKNKPVETIKIFLLSGDWIPVGLPKEVAKYFPNCQLFSLGGATEAAIWSIYYQIDKNKKYEPSIPYGVPMNNQYFKILNENYEECPDEVIGNLYIGGLGLAIGYFKDVEMTKSKFIIHPDSNERLYLTGDLAKYQRDGVIQFIGRNDTQLKIRGHRIEPKEIESTLENMEKVEAAAVVYAKEKSELGLAAFVQTKENRKKTRTMLPRQVLKAAVGQAGDISTQHINRSLFAQWASTASQTAIYDIWDCLQNYHIFTEDQAYSLQEIQNRLKVHPYYYRLLQRWLDALCKEKVIVSDGQNSYRLGPVKIASSAKKDSWSKWWQIENEMHYGKELVAYFEESSQNLPALLQGEIDAIDLFFPKGEFRIALAAYHSNLVSQSLNQVMIGSIECILQNNKFSKDAPLKILEVGAGVGGASLDIIPHFSQQPIDYQFTDISQFFLNEAQAHFSSYDFVHYSLYDINQPYWKQGIQSKSYDIILCNNVLHNAKHLPKVLAEFREILREGGMLIMADTTGENHSLLTSMAFHAGLSEFEDFRQGNNQTFIQRKEWIQLLLEEGIELAAVYPLEEDLFSLANQAVFVGQYVSKKEKLDKQEVSLELTKKLPHYMLPKHIELLDSLPVTPNGKIDRNLLIERLLAASKKTESSGKETTGQLEKSIEVIWKKALNKQRIWRDENFYQAGGDSLLLAQIVSEMKEEIPELVSWEWDQIMLEITESPTIKEIAYKIKQNENEIISKVVEQDESFIKIYEKNVDSESGIVLFHDGTGTLTPYDELTPYLIKENNEMDWLIGFQYGAEKEYLNLETNSLIQQLGQRYGEELVKLNLTKFKLVGYCMGGLIAVEAANYLIEAGKEVEPVITIDTTPCDPRLRNELLMERTFGLLIGSDLEKSGHRVNEEVLKEALLDLLSRKQETITNSDLCQLTGPFEDVAGCYQTLSLQSQEKRLSTLFQSISRLNESTSTFQQQRLMELYEIFCKSFAGMSLYNRKYFMGDVMALNCQDKSSNFLPVLDTRNLEFWEEITLGNLESITINGDHISCMKQPYVEEIAYLIVKPS